MGAAAFSQMKSYYASRRLREDLSFSDFVRSQERRVVKGYPVHEGDQIPSVYRKRWEEYLKTVDINQFKNKPIEK